jgi:hypothetical protein
LFETAVEGLEDLVDVDPIGYRAKYCRRLNGTIDKYRKIFAIFILI